ncbi:DUF6482 family protein [Thalassotalea ganghwensis]
MNADLAFSKDYRVTILCIAESNHYLVGVRDSANNFNALPGCREVECCNSLIGAKRYLTQQDISTWDIIYQSPYDEMCGID